MKILVAKCTELGDRERNEDYYMTSVSDKNYFFSLADGLGGHGLGDEASKTVCTTAINYLTNHKGVLSNEIFEEIYNLCQENLYKKQEKLNASGKMRTTLNLLCIDDRNIYWSHIGDSRIYYFKQGELVRRTLDHSVPQMLVSVGELSDSQIRFHEDRNRLLKVLGVEDQKPSYEVEQPIPLSGDQQFLLCSDGFWELITEEQMLLCLEEAEEPQLWLDNMMELVHKNGRNKSKDNITAIAIWILEDR